MTEQVEGMFDGNVVVLSAAVDERDTALLGEREAALVANAVVKRQREFATARRLAREALLRFDVSGFEIVHDTDRAPIWPEGIAGSLTHCHKRALVAIGRRDEVGTVGIDAEDRPGLPLSIWDHVLLDVERGELDRLPEAERGFAALAIFSAKESLYKAQYPRTRLFMDFADLRIDDLHIGERDGTFRCVFQRDVGPIAKATVVGGRLRVFRDDGVIVTTVQMRDR